MTAKTRLGRIRRVLSYKDGNALHSSCIYRESIQRFYFSSWRDPEIILFFKSLQRGSRLAEIKGIGVERDQGLLR